jgi:DNA helicase HerA-like ATPase
MAQDSEGADARTIRLAGRSPLGRVLAVTGSRATVCLRVDLMGTAADSARATVGKFLGIHTRRSILVGVITTINGSGAQNGPDAEYAAAEIDLLGEIKHGEGGDFFQRGVTEYAAIGDEAALIGSDELRLIYDISGPSTTTIGRLQQDETVPAYVNIEDMLRKHFALFGTTGVGKSSGLALILRQVLEKRADMRVFLIDPHNEYGQSFDDRAHVLNPRNVRLPFWLFNFEEIVDVFFRGRPGVDEEVGILAELIPQAKAMFAQARGTESVSIRKSDPGGSGFTPDTPVPYRLADLVAMIDERMGKLENRAVWTRYHRLIARIETVRADPRYTFMFDNANVGGDTMVEVLSHLFRLPPEGKPMTIMQLAGFPAEVVDSVVSVLCRMAFEFGLWSDGALPLLVVCEEAHRYAPADRSIGFGPTRKAVSRIAKEGRKYGVYLGLVTQRPAELDATIISQCSTIFAMRMANDNDQAIVRAAVSDAAGSLLSFVPSLGTREVFAFGEGVALPTRLHFHELPEHMIPRSEALGRNRMDVGLGADRDFIAAVIERWRGAMMTTKLKAEEREPEWEPPLEDAPVLDPSAFAFEAEPSPLLRRDPVPLQEPAAPISVRRQPALEPAVPAANSSFAADLQDLRRRLKGR